jgi:phospholipase C
MKSLRQIGSGIALLATGILWACGGGSSHVVATPTVSLTTSTASIASGQSVTLTWTASNASSVTITAAAGTATRTVTTSSQMTGSVTDTPTATTTYTAVATGAGGSSSPQTATVQVAQNAAPQITQFTASPTTVSGGQSTTITWATANATAVTITPSVLQPDESSLPTSGNAVAPITATTTYSITATGPGGTTAPQTLTITVPFTLSFSASPSTVTSGQPSTLSWQITGGTATSLFIADSSGNSVCNPCALPQGTASVSPSASTTYTATAGVSGTTTVTSSATVTLGIASTGVIKHIFFMLQENRSFDMYLGQLAAYRATRLAQFGITDTQTIEAFNPAVTLTNSHTGAQVQPFHEPSMCTGGISPAWEESHHDTSLVGGDAAWATTTTFTDSSFGMMGFLDSSSSVPDSNDPNGTRVMGYYNQQDLPFYYDLATFFPTSDSWHSPILANTVPNRMYLMAATSFGHEYPDDSGHPEYAQPTIFRAMNTANVSWLYYYQDGIFLANFADFFDPAIEPKTFPVSDLMNRLAGTCSGGPCDPDKALPQVIFIDSGSGESGLDEHPLNNIQKGASYVQSIISALMQSDAWQDSIFILSYDEGGGLYDHVPPFMVPPPDQYAPGQCPDPNNGSPNYCLLGTNIKGTFNLTGFRVPVIVISPYAKPNFVSHTPRDYTAILAYIEETFGVKALTARDAYWQDPSRDMSEFFDFTAPPAMLVGPNGKPWSQILMTQPTTGVCDPTKEAGPTL